MEIYQGIVTELDVKTSNSYVRGEGPKTHSTTLLKLDNGFKGWLSGGSSVPILNGDKIVVLSKTTKRSMSSGTKIQAFYNATQNIQKPDKKSNLIYAGAAGLSWVLSIWSFNVGSGGPFFVLLALSIFLTVQTYQRTRILNMLKDYLNQNSNL